ncbi:MAG: hypothetical protein LKE53_10085 [Oscillospiraceae bacterium]|jgi:hypothetical protein|nr:hypothetical protein [Oscillospiraceae bacterium]MDD3261121.1 hypothetical protein [Oscillospiraceae bacterium]
MMGIINDLGKQLSDTFGDLLEKNRRAAAISRLRVVIQNERDENARAYVALGKYYYDHMRGQGSTEAEALCDSIDECDRRLKNAFKRMEEIREETDGTDEASPCTECSSDCSTCQYNQEDEPESPAAAEPQPKEAPSEAAPYDPYDTTPSPIAHDPDNIEIDDMPPKSTPITSADIPPAAPAVSPAVTPADEEAAPEEPEA